jgi:hypothetical protein
MPATDWRTLRREIMRPLGLVEFTTTTEINPDNSIVSLELTSRFNNDDHFNGWFATIVIDADGSTTPANGLGTTTRRVTDYAAATGTLTVADPALADEASDHADVDLYRFHPDDILRAFNRARQDAFPHVGIVRNLDTLVTGPNQSLFTVPSTVRRIKALYVGDRIGSSHSLNVLDDGGFEDWASSSSLTNWTLAGSGSTVTQETQTASPQNYAVLEGTYSARLNIANTTLTTLLTTVNPTAAIALEDMEVHTSVWVYALQDSTLSGVTAIITGVGVEGTTVVSTAHGGTGWEKLTASGQTKKDADTTNVTVGVRHNGVGNGYGCYVDEAVCIIGPTEPLEGFWTPVQNYEWLPPVAGASDGGQIRVDEYLPAKQSLRIVGVDQLSAITVDTSTVEVDIDLLDPLYNLTRAYLCEEAVKQSTSLNYIRLWGDRQSEYMRRFDDGLNSGHTLRMPRKPLQIPDRVY